jgi:methionyl-tRNA formyltransferase
MACDQRFAHRRRKSAPRDVTADGPIVARPSLIQHVAENNPGKTRMKLTLVGSRYFGAAALERLLKEGIEIARVIVPATDDRLAMAAKAAGLEVFVLDDPLIVPAEAIADGTDLIVAAHSHARVTSDALARSRLGGIGFHPSLLPRHRGIAAVEWTIREGDPIAGGSIYHLAERMDAGAIAAQDWCFVRKGETARELWERSLAPMGLDLLLRVIREARISGKLPATPQDEQFATRAPMHRK